MTENIAESVKNYYGHVLQSQSDLKTTACCSTGTLPDSVKEILEEIEPEILHRSYGCGSPIPPALERCAVLDLGCGTGRDVYTLSKLVGQTGWVIGVDMTEEQLRVARKYRESQAARFGFSRSNAEFKQGYIEDLKTLGIEDESMDVVVSNCVINLSSDKKRVFSEIFRVLKPGGELYFSDVFSDRRIPIELRNDPVLLGECLSGALYAQDFRRILHELGCKDFRICSESPIEIKQPELKEKTGQIAFCSRTIRAYKLDTLEDLCEDYGQVATYLGSIDGCFQFFRLDDHHVFESGKPMLVCGNTASMLEETRLSRHFEVRGNRSVHYGLFSCGPQGNSQAVAGMEDAGRCC